ncbi:MAG: hypothetical protein QG602_2301 [Verrucomicrobiota bacterium]|nr:hypothetical protein [Verrucomicrobiota bacterium]
MLQDRIDQLIAALRTDGLEEEAGTLHMLVHEMAWTTSSEFMGEIGKALQKIKSTRRGRLSATSKKAMSEVFAIVGRPWPSFRL